MLQLWKRRMSSHRRRRKSTLAAEDGPGQLSDFDLSTPDISSDNVSVALSGGPTLVTVDDGKGGIKHVRVAKPPDAQSEIVCFLDNGSKEKREINDADDIGESSIGKLLRQEFGGRHMLQLDTSNTEKLRKRIVTKRGVVNIARSHLERNQKRKYLTDFFNTMLDMKWRYVLLLFTMSFFLSWLAFAVVWYLIFWIHGDLQPDHLPSLQESNEWTPCAYQIYNFASCFLFSIETQHTIGYGGRQTTEQCPIAIFVMSFQSVIGVMIQACMVGTIFAKLSRPKRRSETILFSKNAVICRRDGALCLCVRMANMRSSHLVECHVRAILISKKVTEEGEHIPYHQTELNVGTDFEGQESTVLFLWPMTIVHRIDEESPFYHMTARDFLMKRYELIFVLEGIAEPTGMSVQARTSYLPNEILWGHRFVNVLSYSRREEEYKVDYGSFNSLYKVDTPICSAKAQALLYRKTSHSRYENRMDLPKTSRSSNDISSASSTENTNQLEVHFGLQPNHVSLPVLAQEEQDEEAPDKDPEDVLRPGNHQE